MNAEDDDAVFDRAEIRINGTFEFAAFREFVAFYAQRLSLEGDCILPSRDTLIITAAGPRALLDMLAVACSLGPARAIVKSIDVQRAYLTPSSRDAALGSARPMPMCRGGTHVRNRQTSAGERGSRSRPK